MMLPSEPIRGLAFDEYLEKAWASESIIIDFAAHLALENLKLLPKQLQVYWFERTRNLFLTALLGAKVETTDRCDVSKISVGSVWSRHSHGTVVAIGVNDITIRTAEKQWTIDKPIVAKEFSFADQYEEGEVIMMSRTDLITILMNNPQTAMTIVFDKKPKVEDASKLLRDGQGEMSEREWRKIVKQAINGEERTMIGYHEGSIDDFGRLRFVESGKGHRLVDPRTLKSVLVGRKLYQVK